MSPDAYRLPRTYKNRIVATMRATKLDPTSFEWEPFRQSNYFGERLLHRPTESYFHYYMTSSGLWTSFEPAVNSGAKRNGYVASDDALSVVIDAWLHVVQREHEAPDLWEAVRGEGALISGEVDDGERFFSAQEQRLLAERLDQLEAQIKALAPHINQEEAIHTHTAFEHAKDASKRISRIDWKSLFVGKIFDVIIRLGLEPHKAQQVFHYAALYVGPLISRVKGLLY